MGVCLRLWFLAFFTRASPEKGQSPYSLEIGVQFVEKDSIGCFALKEGLLLFSELCFLFGQAGFSTRL